MPWGLDLAEELRDDEQSSPASSTVKNSDVSLLKVDESEEPIDIYISIEKRERISSLRSKLANNRTTIRIRKGMTKLTGHEKNSNHKPTLNPKPTISRVTPKEETSEQQATNIIKLDNKHSPEPNDKTVLKYGKQMRRIVISRRLTLTGLEKWRRRNIEPIRTKDSENRKRRRKLRRRRF